MSSHRLAVLFGVCGPGQEQYNLPELRAPRLSGYPWVRGSPHLRLTDTSLGPLPHLLPAATGAFSPSPTHCPCITSWAFKVVSRLPPLCLLPKVSSSGQVLLSNPLLGAQWMQTPFLFLSWGLTQAAHPILGAARLQTPAQPLLPTRPAVPKLPGVWAEPGPELSLSGSCVHGLPSVLVHSERSSCRHFSHH